MTPDRRDVGIELLIIVLVRLGPLVHLLRCGWCGRPLMRPDVVCSSGCFDAALRARDARDSGPASL